MKTNKEDLDLIKKARDFGMRSKKFSRKEIGGVGCALVTSRGNLFFGVNTQFDCGLGVCAEHSAIGSMITNSKTEIKTIVAVSSKGKVMPPCGKCRELVRQVNKKNANTLVILSKSKKIKLKELLPNMWQDLFKGK